MIKTSNKDKITSSFMLDNEKILNDYRLGWESRWMSLIGRKEVLTGKAKFGIFGDGKEVPQLALSHFFQEGDFRSGYYRDQTFMMAAGIVNLEQLFAQLYAHPSLEKEPHSGGRQMNAHFMTPNIEKDGTWRAIGKQKNTASDISSTSAQMPRAVGLALASKKYREIEALKDLKDFSDNGNEVVFTTIGDASTSEGPFWEAINAAGVMKIPMAVFIWDDGYGISVPTKYQTTKENISEALRGFEIDEQGRGYYMYQCEGWNYEKLLKTYSEGIAKMRETHNPAIFHITEVTQPQGHSTSGSHERYKSKERLAWEKERDCLVKMKEWILENDIAEEAALDKIEKEAQQKVQAAKRSAWDAFINEIKGEKKDLFSIYDEIRKELTDSSALDNVQRELERERTPARKDVLKNAKEALLKLRLLPDFEARQKLLNWKNETEAKHRYLYDSRLHSETLNNLERVPYIPPVYSDESPTLNGYQILNACFDAAFAREPKLLAFGEDLGKIGDVNQGFAGLQEKYGEERIFDTGIRENSIIGQGIGLALRGLRPIAEIQYLDYFIFGLQPVMDDLATLYYRTCGQQIAPLIIRTRGHRLEGIWHAGSPMGMLLNSVRGVRVLVPRNMTQAAGFYNALLHTDEPAIVIECLNGYRLKEKLPDNIYAFTTPFGVPEVLEEGEHVTIVTYGSCVRIAQKAIDKLHEVGIDCELIDVQSLLPFDTNHLIVESLKKTNRILFLDEDVPGGASAYMLQKVLEEQDGYRYLDSKPLTLTAKAHRPAYGSDGDYYSKPNVEDVFEVVYGLMHEFDPVVYPMFF